MCCFLFRVSTFAFFTMQMMLWEFTRLVFPLSKRTKFSWPNFWNISVRKKLCCLTSFVLVWKEIESLNKYWIKFRKISVQLFPFLLRLSSSFGGSINWIERAVGNKYFLLSGICASPWEFLSKAFLLLDDALFWQRFSLKFLEKNSFNLQ